MDQLQLLIEFLLYSGYLSSVSSSSDSCWNKGMQLKY